ncbi:MAG: alpha/beta hydrolase [Halioglobus sp.]
MKFVRRLNETLLAVILMSFSGLGMAAWPDTAGIGACNFTNPYAGTNDCIVYSGSNWTDATAAADCASLFTSSYTYSFALGGVCNTVPLAASCVENLGTADEKINENQEDTSKDEAQCNTLSGVCSAILKGDYFPASGGVCDTAPPPITCEEEGLEPEACEAMDDNADVDVTEDAGYISFTPLTASRSPSSFIFIPGAGVKAKAYAPLAQELAKSGLYTAILLSQDQQSISDVMGLPGNAATVNWLLGGHSLGGVLASKFILDNPGLVGGLALLASYPEAADDLSGLPIKVVSVYAENDLIATPTEVLGAATQLPAANTIFAEIRGGNHAYFGYYGEQDGDGAADINKSKQLELTAASIRHLAGRVESGLPDLTDRYQGILSKMSSIAGCWWTQFGVAGYEPNDLRYGNFDINRATSVTDFVSAQPGITPGASPELSIASFMGQSGNPDAIDFPPIIDGSIECKVLTQDRIVDDLGIPPQREQRQCDAMNRYVAMYASYFVTNGNGKRYDGWSFNFPADNLYTTGPDFIASESAQASITVDKINRVATIQSPAFFATNDPDTYGAAAGRHYCKSIGFERMYILLDSIAE